MDAVASLLRRYGLLEYQPQLLEMGATSVVHLMQLTAEDLDEITGLTEPRRLAFTMLLAAGGDGREGAQPSDDPTAEQLLRALRAEDALRTSAEAQRRFRQAEERDDQDWLAVAAELQETALLQAGVRPTARNLDRLRDAALRNPSTARYVRHNRCRRGELRLGSRAPDIALVDLAGEEARLLPADTGATVAGSQLLVIVAGSYS
jgi:hypothetical protein|eukprot:SAG25_NODE_306_length_10078_cov_13.534923_5_plen_205_part_00